MQVIQITVCDALLRYSAKLMESPARRHIPELDGLRGVAILLVLLVHFYECDAGVSAYLDSTSLRAFWKLADFGWAGVDLFFVLSGFLITSILLDTRDSPHYFSSFYARRAIRIFPLYFICIFVFFSFTPSFMYQHAERLPTTSQAIWYLTYLANWKIPFWTSDQLSHFWSLCVEEQFYVVWPLVVWLSRKRFPVFCLCAIGISLGFGVAFEMAGLPWRFVLMASVPRMAAIILGSLVAWASRQYWLYRVTDNLKLILPASFLLVLVCAIKPPYFRSFYTLEFLVAAIAASAFLLQCITHPEGGAARLMRTRVLRIFGRYSYAIYIFHPMAFYYTQKICSPFLFYCRIRYHWPVPFVLCALFVTMFGSAFLVGFLSWNLFEKHCLRLKSYFPYSVPVTPVPQGTSAGVS